MKTTLLVHLSDLHIREKDSAQWSRERAVLIAQSAVRKPHEQIILIVSGDTSFSGQNEEFKIAEEFLSHIAAELTITGGCPVSIAVAAGNHDCDFSAQSSLREFALSQRSTNSLIDSEILEKLSEPLKNFRNFEARIESFQFQMRSALDKSGVIEIAKTKIQLRIFCSALYSKINEQKGELFLPIAEFEQGWEENCVRISVMHHPSTWFDQSVSRGIRSALRKCAHVCLFGHEHVPEISEIATRGVGESTSSIEVDGAVLQEHGTSKKSSFVTLELDLKSNSVAATAHEWDDAKKFFNSNSLTSLSRPESWMTLPRTERNFVVSAQFENKLADPGIVANTSSGRQVSSADLYVYPELAWNMRGKNRVEEISSARLLLQIDKLSEGVILQGDEKYGKTALLFRLFDGYHSAGMVPIYISLRDQKIRTAIDIQRTLNSAIKSIYIQETADSFAAVQRQRKIFLIDDIDSLKTEQLREAVLDFIKAHCDLFVVTTTIKPQISEALSDDGESSLNEIRQFRIERFNSSKRSEMINKWVEFVEQKEDEEEVLARVDYLEKGAAASLGHNMIPRVPHMLLIFLQSSSASSSAKLESGALAHYYTFLVTQHLLSSGVRREEIEEYVSFARHVSFHMQTTGLTYVSLADLDACNTSFSQLYFPGTLSSRLNVLKNAKLIEEFGSDSYQWRHGYFHYLFLGEYLGKRLQDPKIREIVDEMCRHLYVRSNANSLIFLVHFSKDVEVFSSISSVIKNLFSEEKPLELGPDTQQITAAIQDVRALYLPDGGAAKERERQHKKKDDDERKNGDGLRDKKKPEDALTTLDELIVLFKTSEIVGQVLKEQYASIERRIREPIVVALLEANLRAAGGIIRKIVENKHLMQKWIESRAAESGETMDASEMALHAEMIVAEVVQMLLFAFFQKLGDSISSEKTLDLVRNIAWPNRLEPKVFILACELNLQRSIPFGSIDFLIKLADKDLIFLSLIRNLVQHRLSMFHTKAPELQALGTRFKIELSGLQALDFRTARKTI